MKWKFPKLRGPFKGGYRGWIRVYGFLRVPFLGIHKKDYSILGSTLMSLYLGKLPYLLFLKHAKNCTETRKGEPLGPYYV